MFFMLLFILLLIAGIAFFVKWTSDAGPKNLAAVRPDSSRALEILAERYARDEIPRSEFEAKRKDILQTIKPEEKS